MLIPDKTILRYQLTHLQRSFALFQKTYSDITACLTQTLSNEAPLPRDSTSDLAKEIEECQEYIQHASSEILFSLSQVYSVISFPRPAPLPDTKKDAYHS